jgi:Flp pilus assembly protein TadG
MALILPTLLLLIVGVADLSRAFYAAMSIRQAAQAGALYAVNWTNVTSLCPNPCATDTTRTFIKQNPTGITITDADIILTPADAWSNNPSLGWKPNQSFTITVNHTFNFITPVLSNTKLLQLTTTVTATRNP